MPGLIISANSAPKCSVTSRHCKITSSRRYEEDDMCYLWYFIETRYLKLDIPDFKSVITFVMRAHLYELICQTNL